MMIHCAIKIVGKKWSDLPQTIFSGKDWPDVVRQVKNSLREENSQEARLSNTKGYDNQGWYINL